MAVRVLKEQEVIQEAVAVLLASMSPAKIARCLSLFEKIQATQKTDEEAL